MTGKINSTKNQQPFIQRINESKKSLSTQLTPEITHVVKKPFVEVSWHQLEEVRVQQRENLVPSGLVNEGVIHAVHRQRGSVAVPVADAPACVCHGDVRVVPRVTPGIFSANESRTNIKVKRTKLLFARNESG